MLSHIIQTHRINEIIACAHHVSINLHEKIKHLTIQCLLKEAFAEPYGSLCELEHIWATSTTNCFSSFIHMNYPHLHALITDLISPCITITESLAAHIQGVYDKIALSGHLARLYYFSQRLWIPQIPIVIALQYEDTDAYCLLSPSLKDHTWHIVFLDQEQYATCLCPPHQLASNIYQFFSDTVDATFFMHTYIYTTNEHSYPEQVLHHLTLQRNGDEWPFLLEESTLRILSQALYKEADPDGVCLGFSIVAIQALLAKGVPSFDQRLARLSLLWQEHHLDPNTVIANMNPDIDMRAFFDSLHIGMDGPSHPELSIDVVSQRSPEHLLRALALICSCSLEQSNSTIQLDTFSGVYTEEMLLDYFISLRTVYQQHPITTEPIALQLCSDTHSLTVSYSPIEETWLYFDTQYIFLRKIPQERDLVQFLSSRFASCRTKDNEFPLATRIVFTQNASTTAILISWKQSHPYQALHRILPEQTARNSAAWHITILTKCNPSYLQELLQANVDINHQDQEGVTLLLDAACEGNSELTRFLLAHGADPNRATHTQTIPLHEALWHGYLDITTLLIEAGSDIYKRDIYNQSPADSLSYLEDACSIRCITPLSS